MLQQQFFDEIWVGTAETAFKAVVPCQTKKEIKRHSNSKLPMDCIVDLFCISVWRFHLKFVILITTGNEQ